LEKGRLVFKRYFWVLYLILGGAFAYVGADIVKEIISERLRLSPQVSQRKPFRVSKQENDKDPSFYALIHKRDVFHSAVEKVGAKKTTTKQRKPLIKEETLEKTPLQVRLRGTVYREPGKSLAIIEDIKTRKQDLYHVGDVILGEAKLVAVSRNKVYLERDGKREILEVYEEPKVKARERAGGGRPRKVSIPEGAGIRRLSANRYRIPREDLSNAFDNMSQLLTQVRMVPNFTDGEPDGFKLLSIKAGSLIHRSGLRDGDIIKRVNGIEIESPETAFEVYEQVKNEPTITVEIVRGGRRRTFTYEVR
jgi:general secretion pathway protein C